MQNNCYFHLKPDSMKLRISLGLVSSEFLKSNFGDKLITLNSDTGEIFNEKTLNRFVYSKEKDVNVSSMTFEIEKVWQGSKKPPMDVLTFMVTSKHLGKDYYKGITSDTFPIIYDYICSSGLIIPYDVFIKEAEYLDLDVCYDAIVGNYKALRDAIKTRAKLSNKFGSGFHEFTLKDENIGFHFGTRKTATASKPYIKVYSKTLDAVSSKHKAFFKYYSIATADELFRTEFTLKNKKHICNTYKLSNKLIDLFAVNQDTWINILHDITSRHIDKPTIETSTVLSDTKQYTSSIELWIELFLLNKNDTITLYDIERYLESNLKNRNTMNHNLELLKIVNNRILENNDNYKDNLLLNEFLKFML